MPQSAKLFSERINKCLDETDAPESIRERATILSKMVDIPKPVAWSIIEGQTFPEPNLVQKIATEFEVDPKWLSGEK